MGINKLNRPGSLDQQVNAAKKTEKNTKLMSGYFGCKWVGDGSTGTHAGDWYAVQGIDACVLDVSGCVFKGTAYNDGLVESSVAFGSAADIVIPNGAIIYMPATTIKLVSGKAILYKGNPAANIL